MFCCVSSSPILIFSDDEGDDDEDDSDEYEDVDDEDEQEGEVVDDPALQVRGVQLTPRSPREDEDNKENVVRFLGLFCSALRFETISARFINNCFTVRYSTLMDAKAFVIRPKKNNVCLPPATDRKMPKIRVGIFVLFFFFSIVLKYSNSPISMENV